ncbi:MAG: hypothetical protein LBL74_05680 [Bacteroidales bacterium]|jgi:hypothetical protein|nr:hypothetical protein [Bacteroidales bacterium]
MAKTNKKHLIISYNNLSEDLQSRFSELYNAGYADIVQKITKPNGSVIFVVPFETEDISYMVKVDVKIDDKLSDDEFEKDLFNVEEDDDSIDKDNVDESDSKHNIVLIHGDYSSVDTADDISE